MVGKCGGENSYLMAAGKQKEKKRVRVSPLPLW
jgi:hypothetical protein